MAMKTIVLNDYEYELIKDYKNAFDSKELMEKCTDYFKNYDYILGDYSYDKLRLKGFCNKKNSNLNEYNDYDKLNDYLKDFCSYECPYYILEKKN
jgi:uncharacterized protein YutD